MGEGSHEQTSRKPFAIAFAAFIVACFVVGAFTFQYYNHLQLTIREESSGYLREITARIGLNIDRIIADNQSFLTTLSTSVDEAGIHSFSGFTRLVDRQRSSWDFKDIILIDDTGKAYSSSGIPVKVDGDTSFIDTAISGTSAISNALMIDNQECIALSAPLNNHLINGTQFVAIAAVFNPATFDKALSMSSFDGRSFSCIIQENGTIVVKSSSTQAMEMGYNVLNTMVEADPELRSALPAIKESLVENQKGEVTFERDGERYYAIFTPISPERWYLMSFIPSSVVNAKSDILLGATLLICGIITATFAGLVAFLLFLSARNRRRLEQIAYVDDVTGGHTIERFYELAQESLSQNNRPSYALVYSNMEKFKVFNEQFGRSACNDLLRMFNAVVEQNLHEGEYIGRLAADNFCILVCFEGEEVLRGRFMKWYNTAEEFYIKNRPEWALPMVEFGIFLVEDEDLPFPQMIDRAKLALRESSTTISNKLHYALYDDNVRRVLFREMQLEDMMERALLGNEFRVYLQPKYRLSTNSIGGAEALVRWASPTEGLIFPDEFIPLFEQNGFIIPLDLWVFEEVCRTLRSWIDRGLDPIKISVNCSRAHLKHADFIEGYSKIAKQYNVSPSLLEIELTESVVMDESQNLEDIINSIHRAGFECSIDDFGSGYSSLNMIQSVPVDTLKLDKIFFRGQAQDAHRAQSVIQSIVSMARALNTATVAEGVEIEEHVSMLRTAGCDFVQGYVFARPMPISDFEDLAFPEREGASS